MAKDHAIVTSCDAKYGDFLIDHWLRSLQVNVNLTGIDVVVLDYGLTDMHRKALNSQGVYCFPCTKDGFVGNLRYRDIVRLIDEIPYDQILSADSGDLIFQADISHLFMQDQDSFRVVREELRTPYYELVMRHEDLSVDMFRKMLICLGDKAIINGGFVLGPAGLFRDLWRRFQEYSDSFQCYGTDQMILNYLMCRDGFVALDSKYNFVLVASRHGYSICEGVFRDGRGQVIPVVHNAGSDNFVRPIRNFGYGPGRNMVKLVSSNFVRLFIHAFRIWHYVATMLVKRGETVKENLS